MSRTPEGRVKKAAARIIEEHGVYSFMPVAGEYNVLGLFDQVLCVNGYFVGIEYKRDYKQKPTPLQILNAEDCRTLGQGITLLLHKDNLGVLTDTIVRLKELPPPDPKLSHWPHDDLDIIRID